MNAHELVMTSLEEDNEIGKCTSCIVSGQGDMSSGFSRWHNPCTPSITQCKELV